MLSRRQQLIKRIFDVAVSSVLIFLLWLPLLIMILLSRIETGQSGVFIQERIGKHAQPFRMYKIRTLKGNNHTLEELYRQPACIGKWLRKTKLDELPQLFNVLEGTMSLVGPRPDVAGYADKLSGEDRIILSVRPGITGPASIKYKNEILLLMKQPDSQNFNDIVVWQDKVEINKDYVLNWSFSKDIGYIIRTIF